jgi:hypothetical protein
MLIPNSPVCSDRSSSVSPPARALGEPAQPARPPDLRDGGAWVELDRLLGPQLDQLARRGEELLWQSRSLLAVARSHLVLADLDGGRVEATEAPLQLVRQLGSGEREGRDLRPDEVTEGERDVRRPLHRQRPDPSRKRQA